MEEWLQSADGVEDGHSPDSQVLHVAGDRVDDYHGRLLFTLSGGSGGKPSTVLGEREQVNVGGLNVFSHFFAGGYVVALEGGNPVNEEL